jgi:hypothetical protein
VLGTDYTWPSASTIKTLHDAGMNVFRVAFRMERLIPNSMTGTPDATYMNDLKAVRFDGLGLRAPLTRLDGQYDHESGGICGD